MQRLYESCIYKAKMWPSNEVNSNRKRLLNKDSIHGRKKDSHSPLLHMNCAICLCLGGIKKVVYIYRTTYYRSLLKKALREEMNYSLYEIALFKKVF